MPIRVLDAVTVGRIAAGEVVERPSSVAKELIENALDAYAESITIEIRDGGIDYLRVTDNGCGIPPSEARIAFENHATSKLSSGDDLTNIITLGFRGEALPSISAVSKVELTSRQRDADTGIRVRVEGGQFLEATEAGCPEGTTIIMRDLFYNTPVRKAFLKRPIYEAGLISDLVGKLMLGNPKVSMRLISNGKTLFHGYGDGNMQHAALAVYGRETASMLIPIDEAEGGIRINGLIGIEDCVRANRSQQAFFINGRLVRCALLTHALEDACKGRMMIGMHPMCALHLTLPQHAVDINVHPNKLEVRFRDEQNVRIGLNLLFERALRQNNGMLNLNKLNLEPPEMEKRPVLIVHQIELEKQIADEGIEESQHDSSPIEESQRDSSPIIVQAFPLKEATVLKESFATPVQTPVQYIEPTDEEQNPAPSHCENLRVIGTAFDTYIFVEIDNAVLLIDQHAAHERLLYEKYVSILNEGDAAQQLLTPLIVRVSKREQDLLVENQALLYEIGYAVEPFGEYDIQVRSIPFVLGTSDLKPLFLSLIDELDQLKSATLERKRLDIIRHSCKRAVKAGDKLTDEELQQLLSDMIESGAPPTCPHGRPVLRKFSKSEMARFFKR